MEGNTYNSFWGISGRTNRECLQAQSKNAGLLGPQPSLSGTLPHLTSIKGLAGHLHWAVWSKAERAKEEEFIQLNSKEKGPRTGFPKRLRCGLKEKEKRRSHDKVPF